MRYLEIDEVLAIHDKVLQVGGGRGGIIDFTLLHSATARPKASFAGSDLYPSVFEKAAALAHSLIQNHPFADANKRTGFVSAVRFLYINGYRLNFTEKEVLGFVIKIQKKKLKLATISAWLKSHSRKTPRRQ